MSANPTPTPEHISPRSSLTPTRHGISDFTSPSTYLNHEAYATETNTPHHLHESMTETAYPTSASSSLSISQHSTMEDVYDFSYADFDSGDYLPMDDHTTPSAGIAVPARLDDDRTPVVSESHPLILPASFPAPARIHSSEETVRASHHERKPLMSPFRQPQPQPIAYHPAESQHIRHSHCINPSTGQMIFHHQHLPPSFAHNPHYTHIIPHFANAPAHVGNVYPPNSYYHYPPPPAQMAAAHQTYNYGPARSQNGSPESSVSSSAASLTRSTSISSEIRQARPKVKLSWEDKRHIVELHERDTSLRQEDIAKKYGVDRSTISKILISGHRWTQQPELVQSAPKPMKAVGGRFPAIEAKMHEWYDLQISLGRDVRDNVAREKAKTFAKEIGFPGERFKASAKWLDKFKDRRKAAGKPNVSPMIAYRYYPYTTAPYAETNHMKQPVMLSRSQSSVTLSSPDTSSQEMYRPSPGPMSTLAPIPQAMVPNRTVVSRSESDLFLAETTPLSRKRSQSSPRCLVDPGMKSPSSGKAIKFARPAPFNLQRQNSHHGTSPSPSPRRPAPLTRANTATIGPGLVRRNRPTSLAASAFGITPILAPGGEPYSGSPLPSPATSISVSQSSGTHSRQQSDGSLRPFTRSIGGMTISPDMSDRDEAGMMHMPMNVPPLTPITPADGTSGNGVFPNADYGDMSTDFGVLPMPQQHHRAHPGQYATMPTKHYVRTHYPYAPQPSDFSPAYAPPNGHQPTWR